MGADGLGRANVAGKEVRLRSAIPGEDAVATVTHVGQHAVWATVVEPSSASPDRVRAPCPVVDMCGGCPWQHIAIPAQRALRLAALKSELAQVAGVDDANWAAWAPREKPSAGYRTRALMMLRHVRGKLRAGFYAPRSQDLVPAEACLVQSPRIQNLIPKIVSILDNHQLPTWRGPNKPGLIRAFSLRAESGKSPVLLTIVATQIDPRLVTAANHLVKLHGVGGVYGNLNAKDGGPVMGQVTHHLAGERLQDYSVGPLRLSLGPTAFVQTNQSAGDALVSHVLDLLVRPGVDGPQEPTPYAHLADLYAGVGIFGLAAAGAGLAARVTVVENAPSAVADARRNAAKLAGVGIPEGSGVPVQVVEADAVDGAKVLLDLGDAGPDLAIVDPPRAGLGSGVVASLRAMPRLATLIYVSCNARTLARDLDALTATAPEGSQGFRVTDVAPVDMFPNTPHAEVVVRLERVGAGQSGT